MEISKTGEDKYSSLPYEAMSGQPEKLTAVGFKTLEEIHGYLSLNDGNIIRVTVSVSKVLRTEKKDIIGLPLYIVASNTNAGALTKEDYAAMKEADGR